jgi:hypothetical protein
LDAILAGSQVGAVIRGVLSPDTAAEIVRQARGLPTTDPIHYEGANYGPTLVSSEALDAYFAQADTLAHFRADGIDVEEHVRELLSHLAGRAVERARAQRGSYAPFGVRMLAPGGSIALHCENETKRFAPMQELAGELEPGTIASFYVTLAVPEDGGELEVYPLRFGEGAGVALRELVRIGPRIEEFLAEHPPARVGASVGDLVIFDAGRHFHRVRTVLGSSGRWTLGGFVARRQDGALVYWN